MVYTTHRNGDDWGMVPLWHCFNKSKSAMMLLMIKPSPRKITIFIGGIEKTFPGKWVAYGIVLTT